MAIILSKEDIIMANKKTEAVNKTVKFSVAAKNAEIKTIVDRPCWAVRALRWLFVRMPRSVWRWLCNIEVNGLCSLALMLMIIILFSILIGQVLGPRCDKNSEIVKTTNFPEITKKDNVQVINNSFSGTTVVKRQPKQQDILIEEERTVIILPLKTPRKAIITEPEMVIEVDGDMVIDGGSIGKRLRNQTKINGNLIIQNMRGFTLPCGVKINGNLIVRNVNALNFCGNFTVNGDIYVSSDSSFGPIPRNARVLGQVIF